MTPLLQVMSAVVQLSGLFHDLGKSTVGFQEKLRRNDVQRDIVRHEVVSALMLKSVLQHRPLDALQDADVVSAAFKKAVPPAMENVASKLSSIKKSLRTTKEDAIPDVALLEEISASLITSSDFNHNLIEATLIWLVITHHKLLGGVIKSQVSTSGVGRKKVVINKNTLEPVVDWRFVAMSEEIEPSRVLTISEAPPWDSSSWCKSVAKAISDLNQAKMLLPEKEIAADDNLVSEWVDVMIYMARPSLVLGDYQSSLNKRPTVKNKNEKRSTYANTITIQGQKKMADLLSYHLADVGERAATLFNRCFASVDRCNLTSSSVPTGLLNSNALPKGSPFYWQSVVSDVVAPSEGGLFGIMLSGTGSGKTRGGAMVMRAISDGNLKFSVLLGRKALVEQTYQAYTSDLIGFKKSEVAMLAGTRCLYEKGAVSSGSDILLDEDIEAEVVLNAKVNRDTEMHGIFERTKESAMLNAPVNIMTIDHIIRAVSQNKGVDCKYLYLLRNNDLLLDEIDDYDARDLVSVSKLIYISAFYGRKVIVSSATTNHEVLRSLMHSYYAGYERFSACHSKESRVRGVLMSNHAPYVEVINEVPYADAKKSLLNFTERFSSSLLKTPPQHKLSFVDMKSDNNDDINFEKIDATIKSLHDRHCEVADNGIKLSAGFVRFNHVGSAQSYACHLVEDADFGSALVKVVCYHSRMLNIDRHVTESGLETMLNRNNLRLCDSDIVGPLLEEAKSKQKTDVIIIVSTTSIQEVGRDHDYDWACAEPLSDKSIVQLAGRVWRHRREKQSTEPAIAIFSNTLKGYRQTSRAWGYPGIESDSMPGIKGPVYPVKRTLPASVSTALSNIGIEGCGVLVSLESEELLSEVLKTKGVSSAACLMRAEMTSDGYLHAMESLRYYDYLSRAEGSVCGSAKGFVESHEAKLNNYHWLTTPFRGERHNHGTVIMGRSCRRYDGWRCFDSTNRERAIDVSEVSCSIGSESKFLFSFCQDAEARKLADLHGKNDAVGYFDVLFSCELKIPRDGVLQYSRYLGFVG